jgi:hypothetical protein
MNQCKVTLSEENQLVVHMLQTLMENNFDQLIKDIFIAQCANMTFYRITQRPVEQEINNMCHCAIMMLQTDLLLFSYLR